MLSITMFLFYQINLKHKADLEGKGKISEEVGGGKGEGVFWLR